MDSAMNNVDVLESEVNPVQHYKRLLAARDHPHLTGANVVNGGALEMTEGPSEEEPGEGPTVEPDLSDDGIKDRLGSTEEELHAIVDMFFDGQPDLHEVVNDIVARGDEALKVLGDEDEQRLREIPDLTQSLEVIVRTDGSRPSFLVREGTIARASSPLGTWKLALDDGEARLQSAIACVGRIDVPGTKQGFAGTGFLIQDNLILTNRHVLEVAAKLQDGSWVFTEGAAIDFGHEFRGRDSVNRRRLRRVVYAGPKKILGSPIDHTKLDLALIELEPGSSNGTVLSIDLAADWPEPEKTLYTIGYPANPGVDAEPPSQLEKLFRMTWGFKRIAPGAVITSTRKVHSWTVAHDATTLGGNSGSVVLVAGREGVAAGLHYGGCRLAPRENWGHVLGEVLGEVDTANTSLRQHLESAGVTLVDRS